MEKKIHWIISIIRSGYSLLDKGSLLIYFIFWPLRRILFKNMGLIKNVLVKNEGGIFFCGKKFSAVSCVNPLFEKDLEKVFKSIKKGNFIDIGANIGKYTILMGNLLKDYKILAIEPEIQNFKFLKKSISLNRLMNVITFNLACSSKKEKKKFFIEENGIGMHSFYRTKLKSKLFVEVDTETLDNLVFKSLNKKEVKEISLIKIDVEGAESEVLEGAKKVLRSASPILLVEIWNKESLKKVRKILFPLRFSERRMDEENYLYFKPNNLSKII
ncbi:hypothetical protein AUJ61_00225 [Candidatus Pacearchaeota archaeon CG1_02_30_18]|nr:MAG: hypothetical protein AUJ61_00225 [Candidatus Pacearchaeota archaeon CG1_02_30_18]